jgi:hypothetical protein
MTKRPHLAGSVLDLAGSIDGAAGELFGTAEAHMPEYHLVLSTQGLMLQRDGWERSLQQRQAAQLATGGLNTSSRIKDQAVAISGWHGGEGQTRHDPETPSRYKAGAGINIFEERGAVGLGPYMAAGGNLATTFDAIYALAGYQQYMVVGRSDGKVYRWDGSSLSLAGDTGKAGGVTSFVVYEGQLFISNGTDGAIWRWVGTTLLTSFAANFTIGQYASETVTGCFAMANHVRGNTPTPFLVGARSAGHAHVDLSVNTSGTTDPTNASTLVSGEPNGKVAALLQFGDDILAVVNDETTRMWHLWSGNNDSDVDWTSRAITTDSYITSAAVLKTSEGEVAFFGDAIQGRIWRWDGTDLTLYHQLGSDLNPYTTPIKGMVAWRGGLWVSILDEDGTIALLRDNGSTDWSRPVTGLLGTTPGPLLVYQDQLYCVTNATVATRIYKTDGTFSGFGYVESALMDGNLPGEDKLWSEVTINHTALAASQAIEISYRTDETSSWTLIGRSETLGAVGATFAFPNGVVSQLLAVRIDFFAPSGGSTPLKVYDLTVAYNPSKGAKREWTLAVPLLGTSVQHMPIVGGDTEPLTGEELSDAVRAIVDSGSPVVFYDIDREVYTVQVVGWSEKLSPDKPDQLDALAIGWELEGQLQLQEV